MAASRVIDELVLVQDLQRSVLRHGNLKSYRVFQLPRLPVATSLHMRTSTTHRRRYHRLGESSFKRLVHTLVYSLCTGTASAEEAELHKDICLTLLSVPTCSAVMQKAFQHDPSSPFDGLPDVPEDLESFLVYLNAVISSHDQGYLRAYAWFDPVYRPLAKACIKAMEPEVKRMTESRKLKKPKKTRGVLRRDMANVPSAIESRKTPYDRPSKGKENCRLSAIYGSLRVVSEPWACFPGFMVPPVII